MSDGFNWSPNQLKAINADGDNFLISAGAGSGKTAVLTERIYTLIKEKHVPISSFLILTFTTAAANEMKIRIREKLLKDTNCNVNVSDVENAHIETFDSFCSFITKKYFHELGLDSNLSIIDENILSIKLKKLTDDFFENAYENDDPKIISLINHFAKKDDNFLKEFVINIVKKALEDSNPEKYFFSLLDKTQNAINNIDSFLNEYVNECAHILDKCIGVIDTMTNTRYIEKLHNHVDPLVEASSNGYDCLRNAYINKGSFPKISFTEDDVEEDKDIKEYVRNCLDSFKEIVTFGSREEIIKEGEGNLPYSQIFIEIAKTIYHQLVDFKKEMNAYSFNDIEVMAYQLLQMPKINQAMKKQFTYIMVDEYQDTSSLQNDIVTCISDKNAYLVGDVKQSIYRFRKAKPENFQEKYINYSQGNGGQLVNLNTSYRSRKEVVSSINLLFSLLMTPNTNPIDYKSLHQLGYGFLDYDKCIDHDTSYGINILPYPKESGSDINLQIEAHFIVMDILHKINHQMMVFDKKEGLRPATFKDFCIIIDRRTNFDVFEREFNTYHVPLTSFSNQEISSSQIGYVTKNLLKLFYFVSLDNIEDNDFIHAFVSISRSFIFKCDDAEIYQIVKENSYKDSLLYKKILHVVNEHRFDSLNCILNSLYMEFDIDHKIISIGNIYSNTHICQKYLDICSSMDSFNYSLLDFISYIDDVNEQSLNIDFKETPDGDNTVSLMTIHNSKGLEYPICYFPSLFKEWNRQDLKSSFIISNQFGLVLPLVGINTNTSFFNVRNKNYEYNEDYQERLRVFYVALTRAREQAILLYPLEDKKEKFVNFKSFKNYQNFLSTNYIELKDFFVTMDMPREELQTKEETFKPYDIEIKNIDIPYVIKEKKKASKDLSDDVNIELLEFGSLIHYLLEVSDLSNPDLSFIKNPYHQKIVSNVINTGLFKDISNENILHEFAFNDEKNNVNGVIDCLIIRDDSIDILDFKLKNIDDQHYVEQLHTYRDYIITITNKKVKMYLIAALTGEVREIA